MTSPDPTAIEAVRGVRDALMQGALVRRDREYLASRLTAALSKMEAREAFTEAALRFGGARARRPLIEDFEAFDAAYDAYTRALSSDGTAPR